MILLPNPVPMSIAKDLPMPWTYRTFQIYSTHLWSLSAFWNLFRLYLALLYIPLIFLLTDCSHQPLFFKCCSFIIRLLNVSTQQASVLNPLLSAQFSQMIMIYSHQFHTIQMLQQSSLHLQCWLLSWPSDSCVKLPAWPLHRCPQDFSNIPWSKQNF